MRARRLVPLFLAFGACAPEPTDGIPTGRPVGSAIGSAASGYYEFETLTTACSGTCSVTVDGFVVSACDIGDRVDGSATVTQTEGHLQIDSEDSDYISRLEGGINLDGSFDVGGVRTEAGASITSTVRVIGRLANLDAPAATISGTGDGQVTGSYEGQALNCHFAVELTGARVVAQPE